LRVAAGSGGLVRITAAQRGGSREGVRKVAIGSSVGEDRARTVSRLGLAPDAVVQVIGWSDDCDRDFITALRANVSEVVMIEAADVVDGVLVWWRDGDGDLADGLLDALSMLADSGVVWLFTPRPGRTGHMVGSDVKEAVQVAGLQVTSSISVGADWQAARLTAPKSGR
jgi:hypothetical protein